MEINQQSQVAIEQAIKKAIKHYSPGNGQPTVTDIHIQPNLNNGYIYIFDDEDRELTNIAIGEWVNYDNDDFFDEAEKVLKYSLNKLHDQGLFSNLSILKPYSFVMVDEEKETISDLLLVDDDTLFIDNDLLAGLDDELNLFLKDLLEK